jgi:integrase/recombinase XerD
MATRLKLGDSAFSGQVMLSCIDWSAGTNRADRGNKQIDADDDLTAIKGWLARATGSASTFTNYRKEAMRLILWCDREAGKPVSSLMYEDLLRYREFLRNPPPEYISNKSRSINHPEWKPFRKCLTDPSVRQAFSVLHALFEYLEDAKYLNGNPVRLLTKSGWNVQRNRRKPLSIDVLEAIHQFVDSLPDGPEKSRIRWVFALLYLSWIRISEATSGSMGDFFVEKVRDKETGKIESMWFLRVRGKGNKERDVVVPPGLLDELKIYRVSCGFPALPVADEDTPLVMDLSKHQGGLTRSGLHSAIKRVLRHADIWLGDRAHPLAGKIEAVHAHLFRHSGATHAIEDGASVIDVRDNLGHDNVATTSIYVNPDKKKRFAGITRAQKLRSEG